MWGGLLSMALGGGLGALGDNLLSPDYSNSMGNQSMTNAVNDVIGQAPGLMNASMYNAAGQVGGDAVRSGFGNALSSLQNSAAAISDANAMRDMATRQLSALGSQASLSRQMAENQVGNMRRDTMNQLRASGASPAAMAAVAGKLGAGAQGSATGLLGAYGQAMNQATAQAGSLRSQASNLLGQDLASRNAIFVDPYKAQMNQGITSLAGQLGTQAANNAYSEQQNFNNPLAGLAGGLGMGGAGLMGNWLAGQATPGDEGTQGGYNNNWR